MGSGGRISRLVFWALTGAYFRSLANLHGFQGVGARQRCGAGEGGRVGGSGRGGNGDRSRRRAMRNLRRTTTLLIQLSSFPRVQKFLNTRRCLSGERINSRCQIKRQLRSGLYKFGIIIYHATSTILPSELIAVAHVEVARRTWRRFCSVGVR